MSNINTLDKDEIDVIIRTVGLVYEFLKENKKADDIDTLNHVRMEYDYSNFEEEDSLELFIVQGGAVHIAYRYIKENPYKSMEEIAKEIVKNYSNLLDVYYEKELSKD